MEGTRWGISLLHSCSQSLDITGFTFSDLRLQHLSCALFFWNSVCQEYRFCLYKTVSGTPSRRSQGKRPTALRSPDESFTEIEQYKYAYKQDHRKNCLFQLSPCVFLQKWINKNVLALAWMYKYQFEFKQIQIPNHCRIICRKFIRIHTQVKTAEPRTFSRAIFSFLLDNHFPRTQRCVAVAKRCWVERDRDKARCKDRDKNRVIDKYK